MNKIAIIIPTFNEINNIESLIRKINIQIKNVIIFVIDDSPNPEIKPICKKYKNYTSAQCPADFFAEFCRILKIFIIYI